MKFEYLLFLVILLGLIIYSNTFHAPFEFDDSTTIVENKDVAGGATFAKFNSSRYIGYVTFALNYKYNKLDTFGYHVVNIIIHLLNGLLVFLLAKNIIAMLYLDHDNIRNNYLPLIISSIFISHPVQTQAVTYISQRFTSLAAFFVLGSILLYIRFRKSAYGSYLNYAGSLICALLAYKTKENTATLPLMIILIDLMFFKSSSITIRRRILYAIPYFLLVGIMIISFVKIGYYDNAFEKIMERSKQTTIMTRHEYLLTELRVIVTYMRLLILPLNQSIDYFYPLSESFFELRTFVPFCCIIFLMIGAFFCRNAFPVISFGILWFFIFLAIESSLIPITDVIFEHRAYLPSVGFIIAFVYLIYWIFKRFTLKGFAVFFIIVIAALSIVSYARNRLWNDGLELWKDAVHKYPLNVRSHLNLGAAYASRGLYKEGIEELQYVISKDPYNNTAHSNLSFCYWKTGHTDIAIDELNIAIKLVPGYVEYYAHLAILYFEQQKFDKTLVVLKHAYQIDDKDPIVNALLGKTYCTLGDLNAAIPFFDKSLKIAGDDANVYYDKAYCLLSFDRTVESRKDFLEAINRKTNQIESYFFVGYSYEIENNLKEAAKYYQQFLDHSQSENPLTAEAKTRLNKIQHIK